ncbi:MAG: GNAT family N-acetyltransferase, partial [Alphaproteobacteria bacterium]|nr:GNAT family N-acetyltransferase [Alphaproteobacteria bacterium]
EWRRKGIGAHILREICESARAEHVPVRLSLSPFNLDAFRLYGRLGFMAVAQDEIQILMEWRAGNALTPPSRSGETGQDERDD